MRIYLFTVGITISILGFIIPEIYKRVNRRRMMARLSGSSEIILAIERLRIDLRDVISSLWQVEAVFFGLLLAFLSSLF